MKLTIELSMGDVEILQSEKFLNDAIMNFYFKSVSNSILCYNINVGEGGGGEVTLQHYTHKDTVKSVEGNVRGS